MLGTDYTLVHFIETAVTENITDPRLLKIIMDETDARIGGTLYSDALSKTFDQLGLVLI